MNKFLTLSAALIGTYLLVSNATGAGKLLSASGNAASKYARTLQGR